jgi:hypothetical protein
MAFTFCTSFRTNIITNHLIATSCSRILLSLIIFNILVCII